MGWKKDYKKKFREENKKSSFFNSISGESSIIYWENESQIAGFWSQDKIIEKIQEYNKKISDIVEIVKIPESLSKAFSFSFKKYNFSEKYFNYPAVSFFKFTYEFLKNRLDSFQSVLLILTLTKFTFYATERFWKVFNETFFDKDINNPNLLRIFEVMQRTTIDSLEGLIEKCLILIDEKLDPYKNHLLIEEIIDSGDGFTYHWGKMFDQVNDLIIESFIFEDERKTDFSTNSKNMTIDVENFEDFFEKTQTMVFNDEINDAFNYFGLTKMDGRDSFKKVYRKFAKQYHPDLNPGLDAAQEMKKINMFKTIIEQYFDKYEM